MIVLVTGGAGYIGSHAVKQLVEAGHRVVVADNLFRGHEKAVHRDATFVNVDLQQTQTLSQVMKDHGVECVMHFAALAYVGESVTEPLDYYVNNVSGTISLLKAIDFASVRRMVFSSTCATYGQPDRLPITEETPQKPINPYGQTKLMIEQVMKDYAAANPKFGCAMLRYFNVAGCASDGSIGEDHHPETHLIPALINTLLGKNEEFHMFGDDYPTADGSCIRDYVHVEDLCAAHILVMQALVDGDVRAYNLGIGQGYSVKQVVGSVERVTGRKIPIRISPRRPGDPAELWASSTKIQKELGWKPRHTELDEVVRTAWEWFTRHPNGYGDAGA